MDLFKRIKTNALLSALLYALLGLVLVLWPEVTASLLCGLLGLVLVLCGGIDLIVFLRRRDGTLYTAAHLVIGVTLVVVGLWLMSQPSLVTVVIPRIIGALVVIHGLSGAGDAFRLRQAGDSAWKTALALSLVCAVLGGVLVCNPFSVYRTAVRIIGLCLLYDGLSDFWITLRLGRALRLREESGDAPAPPPTGRSALEDFQDVVYRDVPEEK